MKRERWGMDFLFVPCARWWEIGSDTARHWYKCWWCGPFFLERFTEPNP